MKNFKNLKSNFAKATAALMIAGGVCLELSSLADIGENFKTGQTAQGLCDKVASGEKLTPAEKEILAHDSKQQQKTATGLALMLGGLAVAAKRKISV